MPVSPLLRKIVYKGLKNLYRVIRIRNLSSIKVEYQEDHQVNLLH